MLSEYEYGQEYLDSEYYKELKETYVNSGTPWTKFIAGKGKLEYGGQNKNYMDHYEQWTFENKGEPLSWNPFVGSGNSIGSFSAGIDRSEINKAGHAYYGSGQWHGDKHDGGRRVGKWWKTPGGRYDTRFDSNVENKYDTETIDGNEFNWSNYKKDNSKGYRTTWIDFEDRGKLVRGQDYTTGKVIDYWTERNVKYTGEDDDFEYLEGLSGRGKQALEVIDFGAYDKDELYQMAATHLFKDREGGFQGYRTFEDIDAATSFIDQYNKNITEGIQQIGLSGIANTSTVGSTETDETVETDFDKQVADIQAEEGVVDPAAGADTITEGTVAPSAEAKQAELDHLELLDRVDAISSSTGSSQRSRGINLAQSPNKYKQGGWDTFSRKGRGTKGKRTTI